MTPTHRSTLPCSGPKCVTAHKFGEPEPAWIRKHFRNLGGGDDLWVSTHTNGKKVEAIRGEWCVMMTGGRALILKDSEFQSCFSPITKTNA